MDIDKHLPKSVNASRLWRHSRVILANQNCERWWDFNLSLAAQMSSNLGCIYGYTKLDKLQRVVRPVVFRNFI